MKKAIALMVVVLLLTGCSSFRWVKVGATLEQQRQDHLECNFESEKATGSMRNLDDWAIRGASVYRACMEMKGYQKVPID